MTLNILKKEKLVWKGKERKMDVFLRKISQAVYNLILSVTRMA